MHLVVILRMSSQHARFGRLNLHETRITLRTTLLATLLSLVVVSPIASAVNTGVPAYEIDAPNGKHSILIGSMHVPHPRLMQPSPRVLDNARVLVIEHTTADEKPDFTLAPEVLAALTEGRDVRAAWAAFITESHLAAIRRRLACDPATAVSLDTLQLLLKLNSARLMSMLAAVPCSPAGALSRDAILETAAATRGLPVSTLESQAEVEQRRRALANRVYASALKAQLSSDIDAVYGRLVDALNKGDFDTIGAMSAAAFVSEQESIEFHRVMVQDRNRAWMPGLRTVLDSGWAVIVVGAGHLPGPDGLVAMLRRAGYSVRLTMLPVD
jgi:uncharacterized protein YbaP (TraB family)